MTSAARLGEASRDQLRARAWLVIAGYPVIFGLGVVAILYVGTTAQDSSLWTTGLTTGFVLVGLSILGLLVYPALAIDASRRRSSGGRSTVTRRYVGAGLGSPILIGLVVEGLGLLAGGSEAPIGFLGAFTAVVVHPVVAAAVSVVYLVRRRGGRSA